MAKSSDKIEQAAVTCIIDAFYDSERLTPYIPLGDKEPVWYGTSISVMEIREPLKSQHKLKVRL